MARPEGVSGAPAVLPVALSDPFCLTAAGVVTWREFLHDAGRVAGAIAGHDAICNLTAGRYGRRAGCL